MNIPALRFAIGRATRPPVYAPQTTPLKPKDCLVPRHGLHFVPRHPLQFCGWKRVRNPALDDRRALDSRVEFPNQGRAVEHHHPLFDRHYLHPFSSQRSADFPLLSLDIHFPLATHFQHPSTSPTFPPHSTPLLPPPA